MQPPTELHPFDALTYALGGRRVYAILWCLWLFVAISAHYALMLPREQSVGVRSAAAVCVGVAGLLVFVYLLIHGLVSRERRTALFSKVEGTAEVSVTFRCLVFLVPLAGLGAVVMPLVFR